MRCAADMPVWWSWAVWLDPFSYALRALVCNEFSAPRWDAPYNQFSSRRRRFTIGQAVLQVRMLHSAPSVQWRLASQAMHGRDAARYQLQT